MIAYKPNSEENSSPWIGDRFQIPPEPKRSKATSTAYKKSIFATKSIFQVGLHMHGACHIEHPWNGCAKNSTSFCHDLSKIEKEPLIDTNFRTTHSFLDVVRDADTKSIDPENEAVMYHVAYYRQDLPISIETDVSKKNDYASKYFPQTMEALRKRNLDLTVIILPRIRKVDSADEKWIDFKTLYESRTSSVVPHMTQT